MAAATHLALEKFPAVFLHKYDGKILSNNSLFQTHPVGKVRKLMSPPKFRFVPLDAYGQILEPKTPLTTRGDFFQEMKANWKFVAIRCEKTGTFLSCRRKMVRFPGIGESSKVDYHETIGSAERFNVEHFPENNSFAFRTWSGFYLSNHKGLGVLAFRKESAKESATNASHRAWEITPLLKFSSADPHVKFVAVINNYRRTILKLSHSDHCDDEKDKVEDNDDFYLGLAKRTVLGDVHTENGLQRGRCTYFRTESSGDWYYYLRDLHGTVFLVVVSDGFSRALAGECVNELWQIHKKYNSNITNARDDDVIQKELEFLLWNYNEQNESLRSHRARNKLCEELETAIGDIVVLHSRNASKKSREEAFRRLDDAADSFRKNARRFRAQQISMWIWAGAIGSGVISGGVVGMLLSGPVGAALATSQIGAVVVGAGTAVRVGVARSNATPFMWKHYVAPLRQWKGPTERQLERQSNMHRIEVMI